MPDSTLAGLTAATAATGGLYYGTQGGADRKFTISAAGAAIAEAANATAQRTAMGAASTAANTFTGAQTLPAGTGLLPASSGGTNLGQYNLGFGDIRTRTVQIESGSGNEGWFLDQTKGILLGQSAKLGFASSAASNFSLIDSFFVRGGAAATVQMGDNHATTATNQTFKAHNVTNGTAAKLTIAGGNATTGTGGGVLIAGGTGTVAKGAVTIGATTDTELSFFGSGGTSQPSASTTEGVSIYGSGTTVTGDTVFDGGNGSSGYTIGGIVSALKALGLIAV